MFKEICEAVQSVTHPQHLGGHLESSRCRVPFISNYSSRQGQPDQMWQCRFQTKLGWYVAYRSRNMWNSLGFESLQLLFARFIKLHVDHLPLVSLTTERSLEDMSERMMRLREEILNYRLKILFTPGKRHKIADCLGRRPLLKEEEGWKYYDPLEAMNQECI
jgi:hypothetical protein